MNGSVFPYDIWMYLIRKHLGGRDILRLTMTCKRLYALYDKQQRMWLVCNMIPPQISAMYQRHTKGGGEYMQCQRCCYMVKRCKFERHITNNCRGGEAKDEWEICENCQTAIKVKKMRQHKLKKCKPRALPGVCTRCYGRHKKSRLCIGFSIFCVNCQNAFPHPFFLIQCEICDEKTSRPYCWFCKKRCSKCDYKVCLGCNETYDPFGAEPEHVCKTVDQRLIVKYGGHWNISRFYDGTNDRLLFISGPNVKRCLVYLADSLLEIPSLLALTKRAGGHIRVVVNEQEVCMFLQPGRIVWEEKITPPKFCAHCATTKGPFKRCGTCKSNFYCSAECQRLDWPIHKGECRFMKLVPPLTMK